MTSDYANARCAAITRAGKRCTGRGATAVPILFGWDPETGNGIDGPYCALCHRHRHYVHENGIRIGRRFRVVHGWLGGANRYHYGASVWSDESGWKPAKWWWDRRIETTWSGPHRSDAA